MLPSPPRVIALGFPLLLLSLAGCLQPAPRPASVSGTKSALTASRLAGAWDAVETRRRFCDPGQASPCSSDSTDRLERHELQIYAHGSQLVGFWDHEVSWRSLDACPFVCGGQQQLAVHRRLHFNGTATSDQAAIQLTPGPWQGQPCAPQPTWPSESCLLRFKKPSALILRCGTRLIRLQPRLSRRIPLDLSWSEPGTATGVWTWTHRSEDVDGDLKLEEEVWQLRQKGHQVTGHYDRRVQVRSGDGRRFECNGLLHYQIHARYWVKGQATGRTLKLQELRYQTEPNPCEKGKRSLDSYQGKLSPDDQHLELSWGQGLQQLSRRY